MSKTIAISRSTVESAKMLVELAGEWNIAVSPMVRAMAQADRTPHAPAPEVRIADRRSP